MSNASLNAFREPGERAHVVAALTKMGLDVTKFSATIVDHPAKKRQPLGLRPASEAKDDKLGDLEGFSFGFQNGAYKDCPEAPLRSDWNFHYFDVIGRIMLEIHNETVDQVNGLQDDLKRKFDGIAEELRTLKAENAALRLQIERAARS